MKGNAEPVSRQPVGSRSTRGRDGDRTKEAPGAANTSGDPLPPGPRVPRRAKAAPAPPGWHGPARPEGGAGGRRGDRCGAGHGGGTTQAYSSRARWATEAAEAAAPASLPRAMALRAQRRRPLSALLLLCALLARLQVRSAGACRAPRPDASSGPGKGRDRRHLGSSAFREEPEFWGAEAMGCWGGASRVGRRRAGKGKWRETGAQKEQVGGTPTPETGSSKSPF